MARRRTSKKTDGDEQEENLPLERLHIWQIQAVRDLLWVAAAIALVWLGYAMRSVTVPLLVALLLAYLFEPLVERLSRTGKMSRPFVVGSLIATVGVAVLAVLAVVTPVVVRQTGELVESYQRGEFRQTAIDLVERLPARWREGALEVVELLPTAPGAQPAGGSDAGGPDEDQATPATDGDSDERIRSIVREELARSRTAGTADGSRGSSTWLDIARGSARAVADVIGHVLQLGFLAFLIPFYFFFFSVSYPRVRDFCRSLLPDHDRPRTVELLGRMDAVVSGFVRGRVVIALIMGVMLAIGWAICGVPHPLVLGLVVGAFCAVPYLGLVGIPVAVGLLAFKEIGEPPEQTMSWWWILIGPTLVFSIVQLVEGYVLTPIIAGKATNLDPVTILVAVLAGGSIMGVYGMLLAIPVAACIKILLADILLPRIRAWTSGEAADPLPFGRDSD